MGAQFGRFPMTERIGESTSFGRQSTCSERRSAQFELGWRRCFGVSAIRVRITFLLGLRGEGERVVPGERLAAAPDHGP